MPGHKAFYCKIFMVSVSVWVETTDPDVPVATTTTCAVPRVTFATYPCMPQPDRPTAKAHAPTSSRQRVQRRGVFKNFRLRASIANVVRPSGHQNANAKRAG